MAAQQPKIPTLRQNFSWTFVGNVVYAACQWGMLVMLAKLGSPEILGQFTLGFALTAPVIMFTNLQLRTIQATDAKQQYYFGDYLGLRLLATGLALLIIIGITFISGYRFETSLVILVVGLAKACEAISDVFYGLIQQHERMDRIAISMLVKGPLSLLFLSFGVYFTKSALWGTVGLAVAWAIVLLGYDIRSSASLLNGIQSSQQDAKGRDLSGAKVQLQPRWDLKTLKQLVWLSLPLGFVMMLISLNTNIPRYFIENYLGERELGIFAAIAYLMMAGNIVVSALGESACPRLAKYYAAGNRTAFRNLLCTLAGIGAALGGVCVLVAFVAGRHLLAVLYQPEYAERADLFVWLMVAAGVSFIASFFGYGMTSARYFRVQMPLFVFVTTISAIACLWLIPKFGLLGAAFALLVAAIVQVVASLGVNIHALYALKKECN
ncbi:MULTISPECIES: oligosaccharide flippase family protein [Chroococcidiopsis]|jgi:O-antigen/teichoic acid export membrane protein|uniref:Polysaccharide biosynthesis protein n=1 Tax=Chroococcidiopsis thermalis (strain PCC 7203) TaxID=251229 RepID=K9TXL1_CHRTP|nr:MULTISPECIES: oligosaccharide flippase family protein [Chroococcidiopsis]AFY86734.1 polysaccharide biosynthesis protein [Chroococcidiopsis thermalis PCC 7203]URD51592.1 oligosaccharide flippase family protein [Chroococcidiopsis sp. CCNUC1]